VQVQEDVVGGEQLESCAGSLRHDEAIERVVPGELGKSRIASACSAVTLSSSRPCSGSFLLKSAGTVSLPSMVLMVSSQTVAAETCTPCADVIACRAAARAAGCRPAATAGPDCQEGASP